MGVSKKMVVPPPFHTPKMIINFSRKTPWVCWGNPPTTSQDAFGGAAQRDHRGEPRGDVQGQASSLLKGVGG